MTYLRGAIHFTYLFFSFVFLGFIFTACDQTNNQSQHVADSISFVKLPLGAFVPPADSQQIAQVSERWFDTVLKLRGFNGGMIVAKNGRILFEKYTGTGHLPGNDSIKANTPMHIASITKTFTAMAVLKLMQDGQLSLDDEFSKYFPAFNYPGVTIRSLLNHRSGLPNYNYFMADLGWDKTRYVSNSDVLHYLIEQKASLKDISAPNTRFTYCNTNYALLALLIEQVSGKSYAAYLHETFFVPLQMKSSYVFSLKDTSTAIPSYNWRGQQEPFNFLDQVYGDKNIYTTPRDLLIWDRALRSRIFLNDETMLQAYTPYSNEKPGTRNYGLGWRMNLFADGNKIVYHNGWWHGSNATFIRLLKEHATIIVVGNKFTRSVYHAKALTSLFGNYYSAVDEGELESVKALVTKADSTINTGDSVTLIKNKKPAPRKKN